MKLKLLFLLATALFLHKVYNSEVLSETGSAQEPIEETSSQEARKIPQEPQEDTQQVSQEVTFDINKKKIADTHQTESLEGEQKEQSHLVGVDDDGTITTHMVTDNNKEEDNRLTMIERWALDDAARWPKDEQANASSSQKTELYETTDEELKASDNDTINQESNSENDNSSIFFDTMTSIN